MCAWKNVFLFYEKGCRCGLEGSPRIIGGEDSVVTDICEYFLQNFLAFEY